MSSADLSPISVEHDGRILTGVGPDVTAEGLEQTMARHVEVQPAEEPSQPAAAAASPEAAVPAPPEPEPKKTRGAKRFDELTAEREEAKREAAAVKQERDALKAQLAAVEAAQSAQRTAHQSPQPTEPPKSPQRAKPVVEDVTSGKYDSYEAFLEDLADWKTEQRLSALDLDATIRTRIEADRASRTRDETERASLARGRAAYADFDAVIRSPHLLDGHWPQYVADAIAALPEPEHVYYVLGKDPALAQQIRSLDPVRFGMELAKLVALKADAPPASSASREAANVPAPYQPVGSGSKTTTLPSADLARKAGFDFDKSGYRERRAAERGMRRR